MKATILSANKSKHFSLYRVCIVGFEADADVEALVGQWFGHSWRIQSQSVYVGTDAGNCLTASTLVTLVGDPQDELDLEFINKRSGMQSNTTERKHYDLIIAWANGEDIQYRFDETEVWEDVNNPSWYEDCEYRIKPKTIAIGGMQVPAPRATPPRNGQEYWVLLVEDEEISFVWAGDDCDYTRLKHRVIHDTQEGARLHREALIKVSGGEV